jgi:hypothetical protein
MPGSQPGALTSMLQPPLNILVKLIKVETVLCIDAAPLKHLRPYIKMAVRTGFKPVISPPTTECFKSD